ncbi:MAG: AraC family transcriptional regulator [Lachnospiraceae bacterium]
MAKYAHTYYAYTHLMPTDLFPVQYGEEQCDSNYAFGPRVRRNYLIHYVYQGKGIFKTQEKTYHLHAGQMFLIRPYQLTYYKASADDPWLYRWIEFNGSMAAQFIKSSGFSENVDIRDDNEHQSVGNVLADIVATGDMPYERMMQRLWEFISELTLEKNVDTPTTTHEYISKAENYIKINIHKRITVSDVAAYVGIDRSHLSRLFRTYKDTSPQQYILSMKMNTAAQYLKNTDVSISEAAQSVGYYDIRVFNKAFKTQYNTSPSAWRQKVDWEQNIVE